MILDVIFVVLLLVILGLLLFLGHKTFASMKEQLTELIQDGHQYSDSIKQELAELIQQKIPDPLPAQILSFDKIRDEFIKYVKRESTILQGGGKNGDFVRFETGYPKVNGSHPVWINAWIPAGNKISTGIYVDDRLPFFSPNYQKMKSHKSEIEAAFSFDTTIEIDKFGDHIHQLRVQKAGVDLTQTDNWETEFRWLRENLEKLYWVLQIQDNGDGWNAL